MIKNYDNFYKSHWDHVSKLPCKDMDVVHRKLIESISLSPSHIDSDLRDHHLLYSLQILTNKSYSPISFRLSVEPGNHITVEADRIKFAISKAKNIFQSLKWDAAWLNINKAIQIIYPEHSLDIQRWKPLILGAELNENQLEVRTYLGLPKGDLILSWAQINDVFSAYFSQKSIEKNLLMLKNTTERYKSIPTILSLIARQNCIVGSRAYFLIDQILLAHPNWLKKLLGSSNTELTNIIHDLYSSFRNIGLVTAYDFKIDPIYNQDFNISRFKVEIYLGMIAESQEIILQWLVSKFPSASLEIQSFKSRLKKCFDNFNVTYISVGVRKNGDYQLTCYVVPHIFRKHS